MGADIKQLRTRIKSVDSTLHLTKAMGLVASSKIRKATSAMFAGKEYSSALKETISLLSANDECKKSPYATLRDGNRTLLVVIAGDRGLAGGYNANAFRLFNEYQGCEVIAIGKRACERFSQPVVYAENYSYERAVDAANYICNAFLEQKIDRAGILYTKYNSLMSQESTVEWLLPIVGGDKKPQNAIFEPDELTVLNSVIKEYIAGMIVALVKESFASEIAARRVAMDNAEKNAKEMIDKLNVEYNRARQGSITQEITEIVAGSSV